MSDQATPPPAPSAQPDDVAPHGAAPTPESGGTALPAYEAPKEKKSGGAVKAVLRVVIVAALLLGGGFVYRLVTGAPSTASVGDCMVGQDEDSLKTIDCADATAEWKVVGKLDDRSESAAAKQDVCAAFPTAEVWFWEGERGGDGYVLCLEPAK